MSPETSSEPTKAFAPESHPRDEHSGRGVESHDPVAVRVGDPGEPAPDVDRVRGRRREREDIRSRRWIPDRERSVRGIEHGPADSTAALRSRGRRPHREHPAGADGERVYLTVDPWVPRRVQAPIRQNALASPVPSDTADRCEVAADIEAARPSLGRRPPRRRHPRRRTPNPPRPSRPRSQLRFRSAARATRSLRL